MFENGFYFVSFFFVVNVWWRSGIVGSMSFGFDVWHKEGRMKGVMDTPGFWKFQFVREGSLDFQNFEWSFSFRRHFRVVICFEVAAVKPNHLSFPEGYKSVFSLFDHSLPCKFVCCQSFFSVFREIFQSFFYSGKFGVFEGRRDRDRGHAHDEFEGCSLSVSVSSVVVCEFHCS